MNLPALPQLASHKMRQSIEYRQYIRLGQRAVFLYMPAQLIGRRGAVQFNPGMQGQFFPLFILRFGFSYQSNKIAIFFPPFLDSFLLLSAGFAHAKYRLSLGRAWVFLTQRSVLPSAESLSKKMRTAVVYLLHICDTPSSQL